MPGFIDLQVNGGGGVLFNAAPTVDSLRTMGAAHRRYGTTGFLPTLITTSFEVMRQAVEAVAEAMAEGVPRCPGHPPGRPVSQLPARGRARCEQVLAPGSEGFEILTSLASRQNARHPRARVDHSPDDKLSGGAGCDGERRAQCGDYEQTREALAAGVSGFTHLYNAMTQLQSREPGMVGAAIDDDDSWFGIIADGYHMHPASFRVAVAAKRTGGAVLVTDAMPTVGSPNKTFELDGETIVASEGRLTNARGSLAGSDLDMLSAVNNAARFARIDWFEAVRMATAYPARALGLDGELGAIRPGYRANLLALDDQRRIRASWIDGVRA